MMLPHTMTALLGPSGSGKSTFLDVLSGRKTAGTTSGLVLFNNKLPTKSFLRRHTGYCEQSDTLLEALTPYEMLMYTAELKRDMHEPLSAKKAAVLDLMDKLKLTGCKDTCIGGDMKRGISGGQAKRTSVGIALITNPSVLFLDEPTSGLDSVMANETITVVKDLVHSLGTTVCATIHSPTSYAYELFDQVILLISGHLVFVGSSDDYSIDAFTRYLNARPLKVKKSLAEWQMEHLTYADADGRVEELVAAFMNSPYAQAYYEDVYDCLNGLPPRQKSLESAYSFKRAASVDNPATGGIATTVLQSPQQSSDQAETTQGAMFTLLLESQRCEGPVQYNLGLLPRMAVDGRSFGAQSSPSQLATPFSITAERPTCVTPHTLKPIHSHRMSRARSATLGRKQPEDPATYVTPWWWGMRVLIKYRTTSSYRDPTYLMSRMLDKLLFSVTMMLIFLRMGNNFSSDNALNITGLTHLFVDHCAWAALAFLPKIVMDHPLYARERHDGLYRPITYLLYKTVDELALSFLWGFFTLTIIWFGVGLVGSYIYFYLISMWTLACSIMIAYSVSSLTNNMIVANATMSAFTSTMLYLHGYQIRETDIPWHLRWVNYVNFLRYSWSGFMSNQFEAHPEAQLNGQSFLDYYHVSLSKWTNLGIVIAMFCFWFCVAWAGLAFRKHGTR